MRIASADLRTSLDEEPPAPEDFQVDESIALYDSRQEQVDLLKIRVALKPAREVALTSGTIEAVTWVAAALLALAHFDVCLISLLVVPTTFAVSMLLTRVVVAPPALWTVSALIDPRDFCSSNFEVSLIL